jgi:flagellar protein FlaF
MYEMGRSGFNSIRSMGSVELSQRDREYAALSKVTYMLQAYRKSRSESINDFLLALNQNLKLWTIFASDVGREENELPNRIKSLIFYLFEFTQLETHKIMRGEGDVDALIDINKSVMKGLRGAEV